jgi:hypothetical protein
MNDLVLTDKEKYPTEEIIYSHIGKTKTHWQALFNLIEKDYPEFVQEWRYYNDGKSWLMKVTHKKKTIFWLSLIPKAFQITFYFGDKAEPVILGSALSEELKKGFVEGKHFGKIRGITLLMNNKMNVAAAKRLIEIKLKTN